VPATDSDTPAAQPTTARARRLCQELAMAINGQYPVSHKQRLRAADSLCAGSYLASINGRRTPLTSSLSQRDLNWN
jgi:hypothetical protein